MWTTEIFEGLKILGKYENNEKSFMLSIKDGNVKRGTDNCRILHDMSEKDLDKMKELGWYIEGPDGWRAWTHKWKY